MYALVDAVSFYASAEKAYDPSIRRAPVVVLTNNDGCVCAICPIARKLKIPKFEAYFKIKDYLSQHNVVVRSSNYELYASLSGKMMNIIGRFCDDQYIYSIDESFLKFKHIDNDWQGLGEQIRLAVWREAKLPVGVGFGATLTLAKVANHAAKKLQGFNGVAVIENEAQAEQILKQMKLNDVWGVGSRLSKRLELVGLKNAYELSRQDPKSMRKFHNVLLEKTVRELNFEACLTWDETRQLKKEIFSTRSFGQKVTDINALLSAFSTHADIVGRKLRKQGSTVKKLLIFAQNSRFDTEYKNCSIIYDFPIATADTRVIASAVTEIIHKLFIPGLKYAKCGLGAIDLGSAAYTQFGLFDPVKDNSELMKCYDQINTRFGRGIFLASSEISKDWKMRRSMMSPRYTTHWPDIPKIYCD
ncbi:Y-family DNA polymerase [Enterobacter hormaechei]|uniref:Y-family DNA polymerase n=8 Tax=Enterobacter cloacae complex TaxID=354276 RepID=A0A6G4LMS6_9ENTR|nr:MULTISPECIES: Y-family DNA polymerase [Enterobacteriaceae]AYI50255.1 DNA polymerase V subunit UmuC [Enterobacter cloacae]ATW90860.1 DNA polymerase V subunit UmuC [Enterobacter sp. CRENT-193]EKS6342281.1 Y-family DNA polymerase [Enterobacter hormaechei]ELC6345871.1 Y-family DNA polymerase [Enterobacter hormaechei]EMD2166555.1 Y-family DNA polymerase [Enterobacter hormaechei]